MKYILPATWAKVERLYFEGEFSVIEIAKQCAINRNTIYARATDLGWPPHAELRLDGAVSERAVMRRIIMAKLKQLETRMEDPEAKPADDERSARAVAKLQTSIEKLDTKEKAWRERIMSGTINSSGAALYGDDDVADWRQDLAERIAKLVAERTQ